MALLASGRTVELREIVLRDQPPEMLTLSPKGTVPVLALADGTVIDESIDIMRWALSLSDPLGWLSGDNAAFIAENDGPFKHALDRYKYPEKHGVTDATYHRNLGVHFLRSLEDKLALHAFLFGETPGLADIAIFPFVRQFAATDQLWFDAQPLPKLQDWLAALVSSEMFAEAMVRPPRWTAQDVPIYFGVAGKAVAAPCPAA